MNRGKTGIIIIGPVGAGKSTQGALVAKAMNKPSLSLDGVANSYYEANGFSMSCYQNAKRTHGLLEAYWVKDDCNHRLATLTVYTEGKTPEETRDEILQKIT